jgi:hypothetical protein
MLFGGPGRKHQVLLAQRRNHIGRRQAFRLQQTWLEIYHDLSLLPPIRERNDRPRDRDQLSSQKVEADIVQTRGRRRRYYLFHCRYLRYLPPGVAIEDACHAACMHASEVPLTTGWAFSFGSPNDLDFRPDS